MAKKMTTVEIKKGVFAMGTVGQRALAVAKKIGGAWVGVRGQRPLLEKGRFPTVKPAKELREKLTSLVA